jgi:hypothetical protein
VIKVDGFDFEGWEASHKDNTRKEFALTTLQGLRARVRQDALGVIDCMLCHLEGYVDEPVVTATPVKRVASPAGAIVRPERVRSEPGQVLRKLEDGRVVRSPGPVHRLVVRAMK